MVYRVSDIEIDQDRFQVCRSNVALCLEPQVLDLMLFLIRERHRMVPSSELLRSVWSDRAVVTSVLRRAVCLVRKALDPYSVIRTVHGRGYQWIAPIDVAPAPDASFR